MSFAILPLIQMSIKSGIIIIFIAILRKVFLFRFPKRVFLSLWMIAITRLLIPLSVSATFIPSFSLSHPWDTKQLPPDRPYLPAHSNMAVNYVPPTNGTYFPLSIWPILWIVGAILVALYFLTSYVISHLKFSESITIENKDAELWLSQHPLRRNIQIRACTHVTSPLTYGIFRPTILFPIDMDFSQKNELHFILQHEYTHIKYFHGIIKLLIVLCFCLHWFNPTVWILYFLANKDMELFCDEMVLREHNGKAKTDYAHALIHMSMGTAANLHLYSSFSERTLKERIVAIMKHKKYSILSLLLALVLAVSITCTAFASSTPDTGLITEPGEPGQTENISEPIIENGEPEAMDNDFEPIVEAGEPGADDDGISPYASGSLLPGDTLPIHTQAMTRGQRVVLSARYSPAAGSIEVGVKNLTTGTRSYFLFSNGSSGTRTIPINSDGTYRIYVKNVSPSVSVHADVSYMVVT